MSNVVPRAEAARPLSSSSATGEVDTTVMAMLIALSFSHLLNDTMQSLLPAIYPLLKDAHHLSFAQIGLITLTNQLTASVLQPVVGFVTDRRPQPFSLAIGMTFTLAGLVLLALAGSFGAILGAAVCIGLGSSIFHPEATRIAHFAAGGRHGLAQSIFQVGGNLGTSLGPLLAALILVRGEQFRVLWFSLLALAGIVVLAQVGRWFRIHSARQAGGKRAVHPPHAISRRRIFLSIVILIALVFSKYFYLACMTSYYTFFLIGKFHLSIQHAQFFLFLFLFSVAAGTLLGGSLGDRFGRKRVIWASILGVAPFALLIPYANLFWIGVLTVFVGVILASAFPAIVVYAQELVPGKIGLVGGLFFGLAFGMGGIGSAVLGEIADKTSIGFVFSLCSFLPLIGLLTALLPNLERPRTAQVSGAGSSSDDVSSSR
jgi:FSR family fosmidomycin resistance protein-like MFS transporter